MVNRWVDDRALIERVCRAVVGIEAPMALALDQVPLPPLYPTPERQFSRIWDGGVTPNRDLTPDRNLRLIFPESPSRDHGREYRSRDEARRAPTPGPGDGAHPSRPLTPGSGSGSEPTPQAPRTISHRWPFPLPAPEPVAPPTRKARRPRPRPPVVRDLKDPPLSGQVGRRGPARSPFRTTYGGSYGGFYPPAFPRRFGFVPPPILPLTQAYGGFSPGAIPLPAPAGTSYLPPKVQYLVNGRLQDTPPGGTGLEVLQPQLSRGLLVHPQYPDPAPATNPLLGIP